MPLNGGDLSQVSYNRAAGKEYVFYELESWDEIYKLVNESDAEMLRINKRFIDNQFEANNAFYFSHNPLEADGFFRDENIYITEVVKNKGQTISFIKEGNYWKAIW